VWVNLYSGSIVEKTLEDGSHFKLEMKTNYPWDGSVYLKVSDIPAYTYTIHLRIPEWAEGTTVKVNQEPFNGSVTPGSYLALERNWSAGDTVEIEFPMEVRLVKSHPRVVENHNHAAVMRGPIVYCIEAVDLPKDVKVSEIHFPPSMQTQNRYIEDTLGGVTILEMEALQVIDPAPVDRLYSEYQSPKTENVNIKMIPYYAWANRGVSEMAVWIPVIWT
jgi:DUF1680 family protein